MKRKKISKNKSQKLLKMYPMFRMTEFNTFRCEICLQEISVDKKYNFESHMKSEKHQSFLLNDRQTTLNFKIIQKNNSSIDHQLLEAIIDGNCPFSLINNTKFSNFFMNQFDYKLKDESYFRKKILDELYQNKLESIFLFYPPKLISLFKYIDLTTCGVERSFSIMKRILEGKNKFEIENLKKYLFLNYNK